MGTGYIAINITEGAASVNASEKNPPSEDIYLQILQMIQETKGLVESGTLTGSKGTTRAVGPQGPPGIQGTKEAPDHRYNWRSRTTKPELYILRYHSYTCAIGEKNTVSMDSNSRIR